MLQPGGSQVLLKDVSVLLNGPAPSQPDSPQFKRNTVNNSLFLFYFKLRRLHHVGGNPSLSESCPRFGNATRPSGFLMSFDDQCNKWRVFLTGRE